MKFQTLTYNRGWADSITSARGAMSDDAVVMVTQNRDQATKTVADTVEVSSLYKAFNRETGQFGLVCANSPVYIADETSTRLIASDSVLTDYPRGSVRLPCGLNPQSYSDGAVIREIRGNTKVDQTIEVLSTAVSEKDTSLRFQRMGVENAHRYIRRWREVYGQYYATDAKMAANLQAIMLELGVFSRVRQSNVLEVKEEIGSSFAVTDVEPIKNSTIQLCLDESGLVIPCIRREVTTGMIFVL